MKEPVILSYKETGRQHQYELRRTEESALRGGKSGNAVQVFFSLGYSGEKDAAGNMNFEYKVKRRQQTNSTGFYGWANDLSVLTSHLRLGVSPGSGRIVRVYNREDIFGRWVRNVWYETRKKHRGEKKCESVLEAIDSILKEEVKLVQSLCYAPPFSLLFPGIHGQRFVGGKSGVRKSRLTGMAGVSFLPFVMEDELKIGENGLYEVHSEGCIDEKEYDLENIRNFVRTLSDDPMASSALKSKRSERYGFDESRWVRQAMSLDLSVIEEFMLREERSLLREVEL
jgi:hypothetical protein